MRFKVSWYILFILFFCSTAFGDVSFITGTPRAYNPSVADSTSVTCLAANRSRRMLTIQNNSAANIMISLTGATLSGIVPSGSNIGIVLSAGSSYTCPASYCTGTAITCYQTSGVAITSISLIEG